MFKHRWPVVSFIAGVALFLVVGPWTHAQVKAMGEDRRDLAEQEAAERAREAETRRLGESIVDERESLGGRAFGPGYREIVRRALLDVPLETLRRIEREGASADLRAAIEASRARGSEPAEDLLLLPAQVAEPSAVTGVAQSGNVFVPVPPCRIADTRLAAAGALVPGSPRSFVVAGSDAALFTAQGGNASGCGIPTGTAVAAFVNFFAVSPTGPGNLRSWAYAASLPPAPFAAVLNYALVPGSLNIANGVTAPLCDPLATTCSYDILTQAFGSETHVVADVLGYFRTPPTSFATTNRTSTFTTVGSICTTYPSALIVVDVPAPGKVLVRADVQLHFNHTVNSLNQVRVYIGSSTGDCSSPDYAMARVSAEPTGFYFPTVSPSRLFTVSAPGTYLFRVNGIAVAGSPTDGFVEGRVQATYHPD
jgi:hypothetical protein